MAIDGDRRKLLILLALLAMATLAGCSGFGPPSLCWSCERGIEQAVSDGSDDPVGSTQLEIQLLSDGDAQWHVRAELDARTAAALEANRSRLQQVGERAVYGGEGRADRHSPIGAGRISDVSTSLENDTLHVRFHVDDFAEERRRGLLFVDLFQSRGDSDHFDVGADRLLLRGPNGTVLVNDPPSVDASPDARTLVWTDAEGVSENMYIVYGEDDGLTDRALARGYIADDALRWAGPRLLPAVPFVAIWGGVALALQGIGYRSRDESLPSRSELLTVRFAGTVGLLVLLTGYVIATGTRLPLWFGWFPTLSLAFFGAHGLAVAMDSDWRHELLVCIAAVPLLTVATIARTSSTPWFQFGTSVQLAVLSITGLGVGAAVWALGYFPLEDTERRTAR